MYKKYKNSEPEKTGCCIHNTGKKLLPVSLFPIRIQPRFHFIVAFWDFHFVANKFAFRILNRCFEANIFETIHFLIIEGHLPLGPGGTFFSMIGLISQTKFFIPGSASLVGDLEGGEGRTDGQIPVNTGYTTQSNLSKCCGILSITDLPSHPMTVP